MQKSDHLYDVSFRFYALSDPMMMYPDVHLSYATGRICPVQERVEALPTGQNRRGSKACRSHSGSHSPAFSSATNRTSSPRSRSHWTMRRAIFSSARSFMGLLDATII